MIRSEPPRADPGERSLLVDVDKAMTGPGIVADAARIPGRSRDIE